MREDEREVLTSADIARSGKKSNMARIKLTALLGALMLLADALVVRGCVEMFVARAWVLAVLMLAAVGFFGYVTLMQALSMVLSIRKYIIYRDGEFDVVVATVSSTTERVEDEMHYFGRLSYKEAVSHKYMFFKEYGEVRCADNVKEGDEFYLAIAGKDKSVIGAYSTVRYRYRG